jgi:hypothetical protein
VLEGLARQHNLRQRVACSTRPKPQHNPLNPLSVAALVLLDPLVPPLEPGLVHLANSNSNSNHSNHSNHSSSSRPEPGLVHLVKLNPNNRPASALGDSAPRSRNSSKPVVSLVRVPLVSAKSLPPADSVRLSRLTLTLAANTPKALRPQAQVDSAPEPERLVRHSPRPPLPSVLLPNNPRQARLAPGDSVPVSTKMQFLSLN